MASRRTRSSYRRTSRRCRRRLRGGSRGRREVARADVVGRQFRVQQAQFLHTGDEAASGLSFGESSESIAVVIGDTEPRKGTPAASRNSQRTGSLTIQSTVLRVKVYVSSLRNHGGRAVRLRQSFRGSACRGCRARRSSSNGCARRGRASRLVGPARAFRWTSGKERRRSLAGRKTRGARPRFGSDCSRNDVACRRLLVNAGRDEPAGYPRAGGRARIRSTPSGSPWKYVELLARGGYGIVAVDLDRHGGESAKLAARARHNTPS